jgi:hypothetical protein
VHHDVSLVRQQFCRRGARLTFRPALESLEGRIVPTTRTVTLAGDTGSVGELRTVIGQAQAGDTIVFGSQLQGKTITLNATRGQIKLNPSSLTIDGGTINITISGGNATRIFEVAQGSNDTINNLTFTQGKVTDANGGAILIDQGATLTLNTDTFTNNSAVVDVTRASGGAIEDDGVLTINGSTFSNNSAVGSAFGGGGAVNTAEHGGTSAVELTVTGSTFTGNTVTSGTGGFGGTIASRADITDVQTSTFTNNTAGYVAGAIYYSINNPNGPAYNSTLNLNQDTFTSNSCRNVGAVEDDVEVGSGTITMSVTNCTFSQNNSTRTSGGGLYSITTTSGTGATSMTLVNDTFFKNTSADKGGGLLVKATNTGTGTNTVELTSLTVNQNSAVNGGGGVYLDGPQNVTVRNDIFDGNTVTAAGYNGPLDVTLTSGATLNDVGYNLVGTSNSNKVFTQTTDIFNNTTGLANTLAANGAKAGYPMTLALAKTSPGYEMGYQALAGMPSPWGIDERGLTRQSGSGLKVSIGAEDPDAM